MNADEIARICQRCSVLPLCLPQTQRDLPEHTPEEKFKILMDQYSRDPAIFLQKHGKLLSTEEIQMFEDGFADNIDLQYIAKDLLQARNVQPRRKKKQILNRRYRYMQKLQAEGDFFSDSQMEQRAPLLYQQYVGGYAKNAAATGEEHEEEEDSLSALLLRGYDIRRMKAKLKIEKEKEEDQEEEEEEDSSDDDDDDVKVDKMDVDNNNDNNNNNNNNHDDDFGPRDPQEGILSINPDFSKHEFMRMMQERFLSGEDREFIDYSKIDNDADNDDLEQRERDEQDNYFDDDIEVAMQDSATVEKQ